MAPTLKGRGYIGGKGGATGGSKGRGYRWKQRPGLQVEAKAGATLVVRAGLQVEAKVEATGGSKGRGYRWKQRSGLHWWEGQDLVDFIK